jgi:hypothetical protein
VVASQPGSRKLAVLQFELPSPYPTAVCPLPSHTSAASLGYVPVVSDTPEYRLVLLSTDNAIAVVASDTLAEPAAAVDDVASQPPRAAAAPRGVHTGAAVLSRAVKAAKSADATSAGSAAKVLPTGGVADGMRAILTTKTVSSIGDVSSFSASLLTQLLAPWRPAAAAATHADAEDVLLPAVDPLADEGSEALLGVAAGATTHLLPTTAATTGRVDLDVERNVTKFKALLGGV